MNAAQFTDIGDICQRGSVKDTDVAMLARAFAQEACLKPLHAEALFRIQDSCRVQDPAWAEFFIDTITDFLVRETEPSGYLTCSQGAWLIDRISSNGGIGTKIEFDLLTSVLKNSRWAPESLAGYALGQIRDAALTGTGPLRVGSVLKAGRITTAEVEVVRAILCAHGAEGAMALTRTEVEILFAINNTVCSVDNSARSDNSGWSDLFMKAIASSVMAASGYAVPNRADVLRREPEFAAAVGFAGTETAAGPAGLIPRGLFANYRTQSPEERALERLERQRVEIITGEPVSEVSAEWLAERLGRSGVVGRNEQALLAAFKRAGTTLAPALQAVVDHHCRAA